METKFNFNSQICTTREQSERLLTLGLKKQTADMFYAAIHNGTKVVGYRVSPIYNEYNFEIFTDDILAWSLNRLIEMMPEEMYGGILCIFKDSIRYEEVIMDRLEAHFEVVGENMYENAISCIEWLINEGYFNKEYLV